MSGAWKSILVCNNTSRGFVLPLALIILAILSALAMGLSEQARNRLKEIQRQQIEWQNELAYRSVLQQVIQILLIGETRYNKIVLNNLQLPIDGRPVTMDGVSVAVQDSAGLLGLGWYRADWMRRLLQQISSKQTADRLSDELADWIDDDHVRRRYGLEVTEYFAAGKKYQPRNAAIRSLDELLELPSMTAELYNGHADRPGLRELLIAGGSDHLNVATAPAPVLQAVLGLSAQQLGRILIARQQQNWLQISKLLPSGHEAYGDYGPFAPSNIFRIKIHRKNNAALLVDVRLTPTKPKPYEIILWHYPDHERGWN